MRRVSGYAIIGKDVQGAAATIHGRSSESPQESRSLTYELNLFTTRTAAQEASAFLRTMNGISAVVLVKIRMTIAETEKEIERWRSCHKRYQTRPHIGLLYWREDDVVALVGKRPPGVHWPSTGMDLKLNGFLPFPNFKEALEGTYDRQRQASHECLLQIARWDLEYL